MFSKGNKKEPLKKEENQQPTYWERVIRGKGTIAENWPTAEELWNDVKQEMDEVQATLRSLKED